MKKNLFLFLMIILPSTLAAQNVTVTNLQVMEGTPSTVTFDVSWEKPASSTAVWMDSAWVFVDYNKAGKMERLPVSGGTLTSHTANTGVSPDAGKLITGNDRGAWVTGDAWKQGNFSAEVMLLSDETTIAGACAYASGYPPVSNWLSDTKLGFTGTPMYEITLTDGSTTVTVEAGGTFLLPCDYSMSSFTDKTGAPGIINCMPPANLKLTPSTATICAGETITLTASANDAAEYRIDNGAWQASPVFDVSTESSKSYTLYAKTAEGCVASAANAAAVAVNPLPKDPTSPSSNSRCGSGTVTFSASAGGNTIDWYEALTGGSTVTGGYNVLSFSPSINASTTYYAQARNATTGCVSASRLPVTATVNTPPNAPTSPSSNARCGSGTVTFSATAGGNTIDWYEALTGGSTVTDGYDKASFSPSINSSTTYYAQARNTTTGCVSATRLAVTGTVNPIPGVPNTGGGGTQCNSANITATLGTNGDGIRWENNTVISPRSVGTGTYYVLTTTVAGCESGTVSVPVTIVPPGGNGQSAACGCTSGLVPCGGTCQSCCACTSWTTCPGFTAVTNDANPPSSFYIEDAITYCQSIGMRLPALSELDCMCKNKNSLPGDRTMAYWAIFDVGYSIRAIIDFSSNCTQVSDPVLSTYRIKCVKN